HHINSYTVSRKEKQKLKGPMHLFEEEMNSWKNDEFNILIMAINEERAQKVQQTLKDYNMHIPIHREDTPPPPGLPVITNGNIGSGVEMPIYRLAIVTEQELFKKK